MQREPSRRVALPRTEFGSSTRRWWRLPTPRELVAIVTALLVISKSLVDQGLVQRWPSHAIDNIDVAAAHTPHAATTRAAATASRLWALASSRAVARRGIVLPLYDGIASLGLSLIMELRALGVTLPVEIPHCGDLSVSFVRVLTQQNATLGVVYVYDVCGAAAAETIDVMDATKAVTTRPLFCESLAACHARFRSFDIKILSVLFARFDELLLVDADVLFFQSPMALWHLDQYVDTGTLFFPDRISQARKYLSRRIGGRTNHNRTQLHAFVETFDRTPFRHLTTQLRDHPAADLISRNAPSAYLRATHAWQRRAGHHADSSVMLWNKRQQPRATAILGSFVALPDLHDHDQNVLRPPSYGDKELYFLACEVADARYAFSDFGAGAVGWDVDLEHGVLCGDVLHFLPVNDPTREHTSALYINSDHLTSWDARSQQVLYRSNARPASHYPGSFEAKNLSQECPFDIEPIELTARERERFRRRQEFFKMAEASRQNAPDESDDDDANERDDNGKNPR